MEFSFILRVPVARDRLRLGERYMEEVIRGDINKGKHESAEILGANSNDDQEEICQAFELYQWLPESVRFILNDSSLRLFHFQRKFRDLFGYFSISVPSFPGLVFFGTHCFVSDGEAESLVSKGAERLDVLNEEIPIFRRYEDQVNGKIKRLLQLESLADWHSAYKGESTTLHFKVLCESRYELGDYLIYQIIYNAYRNYLIYLYKSIVLFAGKWSTVEAERTFGDGLASRSSRKNSRFHGELESGLEFDKVIQDFEDLKSLTSFLALRDNLKTAVLRALPETGAKVPAVLKSGPVLKRGEGPIDYNWNERFFVLLDNCIVYFKGPDMAERRGAISLRDVYVGKIGPFSGQEFALKIENPGEDRTLWFTCTSKTELVRWKRAILKLVLNVFDEQELNYYISKNEEEAIEVIEEKKADLLPEVAPKLERRDTFQEYRAARFAESPVSVTGIEGVLSNPEAWEFYKIRNLVKISALVAQLGLFVPTSLLSFELGQWSRSLYFLSLSVGFYYVAFLRMVSYLFALLTVVFALQPVWRQWRARRVSPSLTLRGQLIMERPKADLFEFLTNLKNLSKWSSTFQSVEIKSINKFEAALQRKDVFSGRVNGELGCGADFVYFALTDALGDGFNSIEYFALRSLPELPNLCEVTYGIETNCKSTRVKPKALIKDTENRLNGLTNLKNELENDYLRQPSKPAQFAESILYDEQGTFFTRGRPYLEAKPRDFTEDMLTVRAEVKKPVNIGTEILVSVVEGFDSMHKNTADFSLVKPDYDLRRQLFDRYLDYLVHPKAHRLLHTLYPAVVSDSQSVFQRLAESWTLLPIYLGLACKTKKHLMRLKYALTGLVAGFTRIQLNSRVPYLPNPGETLQVFLNDGSSIDFEQISASRAAFYLADHKGRFTFTGVFTIDLAFQGNCVILEPTGHFRIRFLKRDPGLFSNKSQPDFSFAHAKKGDKDEVLPPQPNTSQVVNELEDFPPNDFIDFLLPKFQVNGLVVEDKMLCPRGAFRANYPLARLTAAIDFESLEFTGLNDQRQKLSGAIISVEDGKERSSVSGLFPFNLAFDSVVFWRSGMLTPAEVVPTNRFLPSSVHLREDIYALAHNKKSHAKFLQIEVALKNHMKVLVQKFHNNAS